MKSSENNKQEYFAARYCPTDCSQSVGEGADTGRHRTEVRLAQNVRAPTLSLAPRRHPAEPRRRPAEPLVGAEWLPVNTDFPNARLSPADPSDPPGMPQLGIGPSVRVHYSRLK